MICPKQKFLKKKMSFIKNWCRNFINRKKIKSFKKEEGKLEEVSDNFVAINYKSLRKIFLNEKIKHKKKKYYLISLIEDIETNLRH